TCSSAGIDQPPLTYSRPLDGTHDLLPPFEIFRGRNDDVFGHRDVVDRDADLHRLLTPRPLDWHHNQQVHVAIRPRVAARSRAKQNDPLRIKTLDNPQHHFVDNAFKPVFTQRCDFVPFHNPLAWSQLSVPYPAQHLNYRATSSPVPSDGHRTLVRMGSTTTTHPTNVRRSAFRIKSSTNRSTLSSPRLLGRNRMIPG